MAFDGQEISFSISFHPHLSQCLKDGFAPIAFLAGQSLETENMAYTTAESGQHGDDREEVRTVAKVCVETTQRGPLGGDNARLFLLGQAGAGVHKDVHYGYVRLEGGCVKTL